MSNYALATRTLLPEESRTKRQQTNHTSSKSKDKKSKSRNETKKTAETAHDMSLFTSISNTSLIEQGDSLHTAHSQVKILEHQQPPTFTANHSSKKTSKKRLKMLK